MGKDHDLGLRDGDTTLGWGCRVSGLELRVLGLGSVRLQPWK